MIDPLEIEFEVTCPVEHAFDVWATKTSLWWPTGHSVSAEPGLTVNFEPRPGGRIYGRPPGSSTSGVRCWSGTAPTGSLTSGTLRFDRRDATEVDVRFADRGGRRQSSTADGSTSAPRGRNAASATTGGGRAC
jgi:hypothetical protein